MAEPERERREQRDHDQLHAEGVFVPRSSGEAGQGIAAGVDDPAQAGFSLVRTFL